MASNPASSWLALMTLAAVALLSGSGAHAAVLCGSTTPAPIQYFNYTTAGPYGETNRFTVRNAWVTLPQFTYTVQEGASGAYALSLELLVWDLDPNTDGWWSAKVSNKRMNGTVETNSDLMVLFGGGVEKGTPPQYSYAMRNAGTYFSANLLVGDVITVQVKVVANSASSRQWVVGKGPAVVDGSTTSITGDSSFTIVPVKDGAQTVTFTNPAWNWVRGSWLNVGEIALPTSATGKYRMSATARVMAVNGDPGKDNYWRMRLVKSTDLSKVPLVRMGSGTMTGVVNYGRGDLSATGTAIIEVNSGDRYTLQIMELGYNPSDVACSQQSVFYFGGNADGWSQITAVPLSTVQTAVAATIKTDFFPSSVRYSWQLLPQLTVTVPEAGWYTVDLDLRVLGLQGLSPNSPPNPSYPDTWWNAIVIVNGDHPSSPGAAYVMQRMGAVSNVGSRAAMGDLTSNGVVHYEFQAGAQLKVLVWVRGIGTGNWWYGGNDDGHCALTIHKLCTV